LLTHRLGLLRGDLINGYCAEASATAHAHVECADVDYRDERW
jgi:hypothetical protein